MTFHIGRRQAGRQAGRCMCSLALLVIIVCVIIGRREWKEEALDGESEVTFLTFRISSDVSIIPHLFVTRLGR